MSSNLSINSTLCTVFHPEFSIPILGYTEMLDCGGEALRAQCGAFLSALFRCVFSPREKEGVSRLGIPCANSYMPHVTLLSIQSCISQEFTGAGKWKIAFIHSSRSSMLCLPIAALCCAELTDKISALLIFILILSAQLLVFFPFDLHRLIPKKTKDLCGKVCLKLI